MHTSHPWLIGPALALTVACATPAPPAASADATPSGDAATSFGDATADASSADSVAADKVSSDSSGAELSGAETAGTETAGAETSAADTAVADAGTGDSAVADAPSGDTAPADAKPADAKPTDATATEVASTDASATDASGTDGGADVAKDVPPTKPPGKIGACKADAPGYGSCFTQAFVQCLQPGATCKAVSEFSPTKDTFTTTWSNGSVLTCVTTSSGTDGLITCTGQGPDGKACLQYTQKSKDEMPAGTQVTGPNGSHSLAYDATFKVTVTCSDGSKESYAKSEDLCYPLQSNVCEENVGGGG